MVNMEMFDGKKRAQELDGEIRAWLSEHPIKGKLAIILVGSNPASQKYTVLKKKLCDSFNIPAEIINIPEEIDDAEITIRVGEICHKSVVGGVIIQLPMPRESLKGVLDLVPYEKDVDLLCPISQKKFYAGDFQKLPPVVRALKNFINYTKLNLKNLEVTVIGKGFLVGNPLGHYLASEGAKVRYVTDYKTQRLENCQLLIASAGNPELVKGESLPFGCHVVDFGSSVVNSTTIGDFDLKTAMGHLGVISSSPGGMGPLVTRYLIMNFLGI